MSEFAPAIAVVLKHEGGYSPKDAGNAGAVNFGITQKYILDTGRAQTWDDAGEVVRVMRESGAGAIYRADVWDQHKLGDITSQRLATILFSMVVNMGEGAAFKNLQKALGITADGRFGPLTMAALNERVEANVLLLWKVRLENYYHQIAPRVGKHYLPGWLRRLDELFS
jgi:lysozyme family protein